MISAEAFWTQSLRDSNRGEAITRILAAAIQAVEPGEAVRHFVHLKDERLTVSDRSYELQDFRQVFLLGIGKASVGMAESMGRILGERISDALVITKHIPALPTANLPFSIIQGGHPLPDERSLAAGKKVLEFVSALQPDDLLICLISGGGSALVCAPVEGVSLAEMQALTSTLLVSGAAIGEINILRRRLDRLKGGGLVKLANGATVVSLILSDVVGNPLEAIASGPTTPDPASRQNALEVISKYALGKLVPLSILAGVENTPETPKPGDPLFGKVQNVIVGSNLLAAQSALKQASDEGFNPYLLRTDLQGEAGQAAFELATFLRQARKTGTPVPAPACILAGGETTVTMKGNGRGGRNTELALASVTELADFPDVMLASLASDGEDGPTDAAGAIVTGETFRRAVRLGLRPGDYLERNDSYTFFAALDDLLKPGPTGTNVTDLIFLFTL
jgi:glycerate 2-kinase